MSANRNSFERGAEWRRWDLHVHTPESQLGASFSGISWNDYVIALEKSAIKNEIAVIGVTDYMSIDGFEKLYIYQQEKKGFKSILLIPNIEFRCEPRTKDGKAINIHFLVNVLCMEDIQKLKKILRDLKFLYGGNSYGCIKDDLIEFAKVQQDFKSEAAAYKFGIEQFKPSYDDVFEWVNKSGWLKENSVIGVANGKDGISGLPLDGFSATRDKLIRNSHFIFSGNASDREHYLGLKEGFPIEEIRRQYDTLKPCFHGSDAHKLDELFEPDGKRYCWIKADPTFKGLLQAIKEPERRSYIGMRPQKLIEIEQNKTFFINELKIEKKSDNSNVGKWMAGCEISLNQDLVAIIGNKGSGKSALADVIALLGNSRQRKHFSFLKESRFIGKSGEPAKHFVGELIWCDGTNQIANLKDGPDVTKVELVKYIPQGHFETLCNDLISGQSNSFEKELRSAIFSHADSSIQLGALDFDQLIDQQERRFRDRLADLGKELKTLNSEISKIEDRLQPEKKRELNELLIIKKKQIEEHNKIKPIEVQKPSGIPTLEQLKVTNKLDEIASELKNIEDQILVKSSISTLRVRDLQSVQNIRERIKLLERNYNQFEVDVASDIKGIGLSVSDLVIFTVNTKFLDEKVLKIQEEQFEAKNHMEKCTKRKDELLSEKESLNETLDAPEMFYQQSLKAHEEWLQQLKTLNGSVDSPDTLNGLEENLRQLYELPKKLELNQESRGKITGEIFQTLNEQRKARESLFQPMQKVIHENKLIKNSYKLQFQATIGCNSGKLANSLFSLIKQNTGEFRGEEESYSAILKLVDNCDFNESIDVLSFVEALHEKICTAARKNETTIGIGSVLRKEQKAGDVYDLIFGLEYLEPRYSLLFQDTRIEQLSPGQRGALLLIFYLLVDRGHNPIILDQPEENLDNETIVNLLVPVLSEAKKKRQIIMVTHNPNLAVVCDAEQVIYSSFDRKNDFKISYIAGSIENTDINSHVVNVLEGTKPAFDNRRIKYHEIVA